MLAVITGGTGFVGKRLAKALLESGYKVKIFSRRAPKSAPENKDLQIVKVDYSDVENLKKELAGAQIVFHLAAVLFAINKEEFEQGNVILTENLVKAISQTPTVKKVIYQSSLAAAGPSLYKETPKAEQDACAPVSDYGRTKLEGEFALKKLPQDIAVIILRAPTVYGGSEAGVSKIADWVRRGLMVNTADAEMFFSFIYVDDLVIALLLSAQKDNLNNQIFFVSEPRAYTWRYFINQMAVSMNRPQPFMFTLPYFMLQIVAYIYEHCAHIFGAVPALNYDKIKEAASKGHWICSSQRWCEATGQKFTPLDEGIRRCYGANGGS